MSELYEDPNDPPANPPVDRTTPVVARTVVIVSNLPDTATARSVANTLVRERLAACVNIMAPCGSVYRWQGDVREEAEVPVWIKTTADNANKLMQRLEQLHPHDVPEIIVVPPMAVLPAYAAWVASEVGSG